MLFAELFPVLNEGRVSSKKGYGVEGGPQENSKCNLKGRMEGGNEIADAHRNVNVLHGHFPVDLLHSGTCILHRDESFLVDVCGFDGVDLLLEHGDLTVGLLERVLVLLLAFESVASHCVF